MFLLFLRQHVRQMCQLGGDAVKSGNLCSIRISQGICGMFKSRDGTCQQPHLLRFVLCMHWHIHYQSTKMGFAFEGMVTVLKLPDCLPVPTTLGQTLPEAGIHC